MKHHIVVLTGAGISAESGIKTFRDADGLWEGHDVMEVASPRGFANNPKLVLDFYNQRRKQLKEVQPNAAHSALIDLEKNYDVTVITQNVDDLHERAGSSNVIHLHGELFKARSTITNEVVLWKNDLNLGMVCKAGYQLRPDIVWFGEDVPLMETAIDITQKANVLIIIGTSMQVYPAASLLNYAHLDTPIYFIDPKPTINNNENRHIHVIAKKATQGVPILVADLIDKEF